MRTTLLILSIALIFLNVKAAADDLKAIDFSNEISEISYTAVGDIEVVWEEEGASFVLLSVEGKITHEKTVHVYIIKTETFFDFVFYDEKQKSRRVLEYFSSRWKFISDGISSGFIHFNEDYTNRFIKENQFVDSLFRGSEYGSKHGNLIFNDFRAAYLKQYSSDLSEILKMN